MSVQTASSGIATSGGSHMYVRFEATSPPGSTMRIVVSGTEMLYPAAGGIMRRTLLSLGRSRCAWVGAGESTAFQPPGSFWSELSERSSSAESSPCAPSCPNPKIKNSGHAVCGWETQTTPKKARGDEQQKRTKKTCTTKQQRADPSNVQ
eukprot:scaffold49977_cov45-Phaeocystis_antarctica.AAC.1